MKRLILFIFLSSRLFAAGPSDGVNILENRVVPIIMAIDGLAIAGVWTMDIYYRGLLQDGFFKSREDDERLFWPHLIAEYGTAVGLIAGAYGLYTHADWGRPVALLSLGALAYTSMSSLSWSCAKKERIVYAVPMMISLVGAGASIVILF